MIKERQVLTNQANRPIAAPQSTIEGINAFDAQRAGGAGEDLRILAGWEKEAVRCIRCGVCQSVCPVFQELESESTVARGRVRLIRGVINGEIQLTEGFIDKISRCLLCKACVANCPSGVQTDRLVEAARRQIVAVRGQHPLKNIIFRFILKNRWIFRTGLRAGGWAQGLLFRRLPGNQGMLPRLPLGIDRRRLLRPLAAKPLLAMYPEKVKAESPRNRDMRVAFFTGCMINYMYTDIGSALLKVLANNGVEVVIPEGQHCCGTPVRIAGDYEPAKAMAKANIDVLLQQDCEAVVVACGTCGTTLKYEYAELLADDPEYRDKAHRLSPKVIDISELLLSLDGGLAYGTRSEPRRVTYHDPCHLVRGLKVREAPRRLIQAIPGTELTEMAKPDACCGSGGSFSLYYYELSSKILERKITDIQNTGAEVVLTGCPACRMQLEEGLYKRGLSVKVMHTIEYIAQTY